MKDTSSIAINACIAAVALFILYLLRRDSFKRKSQSLPRPPGPRRLPIIGNFHQLPASHLWEKAVEWEKEYGDLIYFELSGKPMLIVNSYEASVELLENRSAIYSSRPHFVMTVDLEDWGWLTTFQPYGETLRKHRAFMHRFIGTTESVLNFRETQLRETHQTLKMILDHPDDYGRFVSRLPGAAIMMNVYAHQISEEEDPYVALGKSAVRLVGDAEHYFFLDFLPWLKHIPEWIPWVEFPRIAKEARKVSKATRSELHEITKKRVARGLATESMTSIFLAENTNTDGSVTDEDIFCGAASTLYLGGVDTSATAIMSFIMQMLKNPDIQKRAQSEIDRALGVDQLPTFNDIDDLPYNRAICSEVLRQACVITLNTPHYTTADDTYRGYHIPAGTAVFANVWAMASNPQYFPDPHAFKPERWLETHENGSKQGLRPTGFWFGFGRRVCPGQVWAEQLLFITIASLLASFNFEKCQGVDGNLIPPNENYHPSFIRTLGPSKCKITPRSEKMANLIRSLAGGKDA